MFKKRGHYMKHLSAKPIGQSRPEADLAPLGLRLDRAAALLGVGRRTLWTWAKNGTVPCCSIGNGRRKILIFPYVQLQRWLSEQAVRCQ
jgi:hypothetical protein